MLPPVLLKKVPKRAHAARLFARISHERPTLQDGVFWRCLHFSGCCLRDVSLGCAVRVELLITLSCLRRRMTRMVSVAAAAAAASLQCGFAAPVSAAMPAGSVVSDAPLPPVGHPSCADVEAALRGAVRGAQPAAARAWGDGLSDGPLTLPAGCALRWLSPAQACGALPGLLVLLGDSLSRHLAFALMQVLSGNYAAGYMLGFQRPPDDPFNSLFFLLIFEIEFIHQKDF